MKFATSLVLAAATLASAQVSYDNTTDTWSCPIQNGSYCAGDSLSTSIIILCTNGVGYPGNCDGHAADRPPIDVYSAPCWELSPTAGNATCSKNCTVFPDSGNPFRVPGDCDYVSASPGSDVAGYAFGSTNSTNSTGTYPNSTATPSSQPTPTGPSASLTSGATAAPTQSHSAALALSPSTSSSLLGAALLAVAAFAL